MRFSAWVKFRGCPPEEWRRDSFDAFWHDFREFMLRNRAEIEWLIVD